jgi:hypothetical protein
MEIGFYSDRTGPTQQNEGAATVQRPTVYGLYTAVSQVKIFCP